MGKALRFVLLLMTVVPAFAADPPAVATQEIIVPPGKLHVREATVGGVKYHVEIQFWKTRHRGQCWNAVGRDKAGNLYLGNSTHRSHSYAYRMDAKTRQMRSSTSAYRRPATRASARLRSIPCGTAST